MPPLLIVESRVCWGEEPRCEGNRTSCSVKVPGLWSWPGADVYMGLAALAEFG